MISNQYRSKVFLVIIAILLVTNITMLGFFLQKKGPDHQNRPDKKAFISNLLKEEVGFDEQQLVQYDTLSSQQRQQVGRLYENMRNNKTPQFKHLVALNFSDSAISEVANESVASQKIIEVSMFNHIKSIRMLCKPDQLAKFDTAFVKVFNWREASRKKNEKK